MRVLSTFWAVVVMVFAMTQTDCIGESKMVKTTLKTVTVDSIQVVNQQVDEGAVDLKILGLLPNPSYELDHFEVQVREDTIAITPWARHDPSKIVIQMMVPFEESCHVKGLSRDVHYTVKAEGYHGIVIESFSLGEKQKEH
jgi:hypothetical protein